MADAPLNPYEPTAALNHEVAPKEKPQPAQEPSRFGAFAVSILAQPISGAGFYLLGRRTRFVVWTTTGLALRVLLAVAIWLPVPKLAIATIVAIVAAGLASIVDTARAAPVIPARKHGFLIGFLFVVAATGIGLAFKQWVVEAFQIPAGSMIPTLEVGDHVFVKKGNGTVERGDVVVFKLPTDTSTDYIKRVVAIGGDTIEVRDGVPSINGVPLAHEPIEAPCRYSEASAGGDVEAGRCKHVRETNAGRTYTILLEPDHPAMDFPLTTIPPGQLFLLGDNRDNSYDSRRWGTAGIDLVKGKATVIFWSRGPARTDIRWSRIGRGIE